MNAIEWICAIVLCSSLCGAFLLIASRCFQEMLDGWEDWMDRRKREKAIKSGFSTKQYDELVEIIHREIDR